MKAAPPLVLLANRNVVLAAVSSEAFLWKPHLSPAATRSLSRDCYKGADTSCEFYLRVWERLWAAAAILLEGEARLTSRLRTLPQRHRGSPRRPIYKPSPTHKTLPVAL